MTKIPLKQTIPNTGKNVPLSLFLVKMQDVQPFWYRAWQFHTKLSIVFPYNPAIKLLGIYSTQLKIYLNRKPACECLQHLYS